MVAAAGDLAAVEPLQQGGGVDGDELDDAFRQRLLGGQAGGLAHRALGEVDVAPAQLGQAADVGGGVGHGLGGHGVGGGRAALRRCW